MSQADVTAEPQTVAAGLVPLLKEYAQRLMEISASARRLQRLYAKALLEPKPKLGSALKSTGLRAPDPAKALLGQPHQVAQRVQADFEGLRFALNRLLPSANELSRQASQLIEHGKLETVTRIELSLRLADFESALRQAQQRIAAGVSG